MISCHLQNNAFKVLLTCTASGNTVNNAKSESIVLFLIELVIFRKAVLFPRSQFAVKTNTTLRMHLLFSLIQEKHALRHASHWQLQSTLFKVKILFSTLTFC